MKIGTQILKDSVGSGKSCDVNNVQTINCREQCNPIDCKYEISDFGECNLSGCNNNDNYTIKFDIRTNEKTNECKNKIIEVFSEYISIPKENFNIINISENANYMTITLSINNLTKYNSDLINNKLDIINISNIVAKTITDKIVCNKTKLCVNTDKNQGKYNCNTIGKIDKDCYVKSTNNGAVDATALQYCNVIEPLISSIIVGNVNIQKNQNVIKKREIKKIKDAKYGGLCVEPTNEITASCEDECPSDCIGIWSEYGSCNTSNCPSGENARGVHLKKKMRYKIIKPSTGKGSKCNDNIYGINNITDNYEIEIDCDQLCPIDGVELKEYSDCNIYDDCGPSNIDGTYNMINALEKQVKRRVIWKEIVKSQGSGKKNLNLPQLNESIESCSPIVKCPINCVKK